MGWNESFRVKGIPTDKRFPSLEAASKAANDLNTNVKPRRLKGRKESKSRRPNRITAERVHHSRGKKWEQFLEAMNLGSLSEREQQLLMDSSLIGGNECFAKWKQREFKRWRVVKRQIVFDLTNFTDPSKSITPEPLNSKSKRNKNTASNSDVLKSFIASLKRKKA